MQSMPMPRHLTGSLGNAFSPAGHGRHVRAAVDRGARIVVGGQRLAALGSDYFAPTLLIGADATMACACEETFGPLVPVTRFETEVEVIAAANGTLACRGST